MGYQLYDPTEEEINRYATEIRDWKSINPVGRMGITDYCYKEAATYVLTVGTSNANWFPDFATLIVSDSLIWEIVI